jgi:PAS domain S-box-containing protein
MDSNSFISLLDNVALLLAMVFVYDIAIVHPLNLDSRLRQTLAGIGLGAVTIAIMLTPWVFQPGISFDARSALLSISGLFFGAIPTIIVMLMASLLRIAQGGAAFTGVCVIVVSGLIGLVWRRRLRRPLTALTWRDLLGLGYVTHIAMLVLMLTLPWQTALHVLRHIALPVLTIFPAGTVAIGALLVNRLRHEQTSQAVRESEIQFRALSEQAAVGINKTETDSGKYVFVNQRFAEIVGYTREELLGMDFHALTFPDDLASDLDNVNRLVRGELHEYSMEKRYRRKDGTTVWVNLTVSPLWEKGEQPKYLIGLVEDISGRKQTEESLQSSETQYRTLFETMAQGVVYQDTDGVVLSANPAAASIFGSSVETMAGLNIFEANREILRDDGTLCPDSERPAMRALRTGEPVRDVVLGMVIHETGDLRWMRVSSVPQFRSGDSRPYRVYSVIEDITERRQTALELASSRALLLEAQAIGHIGDWQMSAATRTFTWSDELYAIHGIEPGTPMTHETYISFIHADDRHAVLQALQAGMAGKKQDFVVDYRIIRKDRAERFITLTGRTVADENGRISALRGTIQDITERKRAELEKDAMQEQLLQSRKMEAIGELAGGIAHDFNNLLTGILGSTAIMRQELPPGNALASHLDAVETAARQAADLTRNLLTFSRSAVVRPQPTNVAVSTNAALDLLRQSLPATMEIVRDFQKDTWNTLIDPAQMTQIVMNLVINARDAMNGKGTVTVRMRNADVGEAYVEKHPLARTGEFVCLTVADDGPGIEPDLLHHIFEPFFTTKPAGSGTGLGLSIVYGIIKQADGWITVASMPGTGTAFDIFLRRCSQEPHAAEAPPRPSGITCSGTVLVVEDEPVVSAVAQSILKRSGCSVLTAPDGAQALDVVREHIGQLGLILLDMTMPGMPTDEIVHGIRALDPSVPILLNSGYTSSDAVGRMLDEGAVQGFLAKPYEAERLVTIVTQLMRPEKGGTA